MAKLEDILGQYDQSNFDIASAAQAMRELGSKHGLTEDDLAAAVPVFGNEHRSSLNSGYTEASNYNAIAQRAVQDALKAKGKDPSAAADESYIATGAAQANERWKATQEDDDDGFGSIAMMVVSAIATAYGVPLWATALGKAGFSMAAGADPMDAIVNGGLSYLTGSVLSGAGVDVAGMENSFDSGAMDSVLNGGGQALAENSFDSGAMSEILSRGTDVPIGTGDPNVFASAGVSDTGYGAYKEPTEGMVDLGDNAATGSGASTADTVAAEQAFASGGDTGGWKPGGIIDSVMKFAKENPTVAAGLGAGALSVVGGIGSALLNKDTAEKRIAADKDLLAQKTAEEQKSAENKRAMVQSGSYFDAKLGVSAPVKPRQLRRPDGSLVYQQPGIITGAMQATR